MAEYRVVWRMVAGTTIVVALTGALLDGPVGRVVAVTSVMAGFGALMGLCLKSELAQVRHPVLGGAAVFAIVSLLPGLQVLVGPWALVWVVVLLMASPPLVGLVGEGLRRRHPVSDPEIAALARPDEALRRQWVESARQLARATTVPEVLLLVQAREQILDDILTSTGGLLPDYVWAAAGGRLGPDGSVRDT